MGDSRQLDKFVVRLPDGLRERMAYAAQTQHTSMNSVIIRALESYLDGQEHQKILLEALSEKLERLEEA
ncbi:Arc-like DNA binding domain-containing protein [Azotobacter beijerinckii]|uniref:Arc-like DNA binding domain-containing protein n=1 Tax=Azotobacter beijerinckii TaxID=170623 RepID=A0A1H7BEP9_9GAMM|nr:Arc family DNA-binding protein [Azotobacter beijerinckii]SEJ71915.1 Arc-like DNA binding domain-containing protein [Azotobacter beijerinckii]